MYGEPFSMGIFLSIYVSHQKVTGSYLLYNNIHPLCLEFVAV